MKHNKFYLLGICLVSALGGFMFGFDWVVIGGAKIFFEPFFHLENLPAMRGWAMSCALIGCLIGALLSGHWSDRYGRKKVLTASAVLFSISAIGVGFCTSFTWFVIFRMIGGLGIGMASNISPVYIAEVSPAAVRGKYVSINQLTIVLGILVAQICNWLIGGHFSTGTGELSPEGIDHAWRYMFLVGLIPALIFFVLSFLIPESPRWLAANGFKDKAARIFEKIGGKEFAEQVSSEIGEEKKEKEDWHLLFKPGVRHALLIGIVLAVFQQWCGINVIFNYAHEIFSAAGYAVSDVFMNIVVTGVTNLVFTFVALYTVDKIGRKSLLLIGSAGLFVIYLILGLCYYLGLSGWPMLLLVVLAIACYAMSLAPVVWVVLSEIFPASVRGMGMAISTFFLWAASFVLTYTFPVLNEAIGTSGTFWVYDVICALGFIFILTNLKETKGKSLEALEKELTNTNK
jgi:sugar porter (SP) family MFS transporter